MSEEVVEFTTIREDFSEYEVENGQILKIKYVVADIVNKMVEGKKAGNLIFKLVSHVVTPNPIDTSNLQSEPDPNKVTEHDQVKELSFRVLKEIVNLYETKKVLVILIPQVQKIFLTNKKDKNNAPHLRFTSVANINILNKTPPTTVQPL